MYTSGFVKQEYISIGSSDFCKTIILSSILKKKRLIYDNFWLAVDSIMDLNANQRRL